MRSADLYEVLAETRLLVVGGSGGVGKTTLSAAIALWAALNGRKVAVLTVDPARRLGAALGLVRLGSRLTPVPPKKWARWKSAPGGALAAAMLDAKTTFDDLVERLSPNPAVAKKFLKNPVYQGISTALSGTHEYMALERILQIHESKEFDLLVLDTPPASAMDQFLRAPQRLLSFFSSENLRWFLPQSAGGILSYALKTISKGLNLGFETLSQLTGSELMKNFSEFLETGQEIFDRFRERVQLAEALLKSEATTFALVTTSDFSAADECLAMANQLVKERYPLQLMILNRTVGRIAVETKPNSSTEKAILAFATALARREKRARARLREVAGDLPVLEVPLQERDPASLRDLRELLL